MLTFSSLGEKRVQEWREIAWVGGEEQISEASVFGSILALHFSSSGPWASHLTLFVSDKYNRDNNSTYFILW